MAARAAPGGASTVSLGSADPKESFAQWREEHRAAVETPNAAPRFPQAPGGEASISLGGSSAEGSPASATRGPVGGATTVILGSDGEALKRRSLEDFPPAPDAPQPTSRFSQAPGGDASVCLGGAAPTGEVASRGPVGGATSVVLGTDGAPERFLRGEGHQGGAVETPAAAPRFQQAPGGTASISLADRAAEGPCEGASATRGPVGGAATVMLGSDSSTEAFALRKQEREAAVETPAAAPRFNQAPGGTSSINLGATADAGCSVEGSLSSRLPVGGASTVMLGSEDSGRLLGEYQEQRNASIDTPAALPRFPQAPGGSSSVCLGPSSAAAPDAVTVRGPVGGATSICLGGAEAAQPLDCGAERGPVGGVASVVLGTEDAKAVFDERRERRELPIDTPAAALRFQQVPGGTSSICLGGDGAQGAESAATASRGPVGGAATIVLGSDDHREVFSQRQEERAAPSGAPEAAPRFTQAPGGNASVSWTDDSTPDTQAASTRGPVGGAATVHLGGEDPAAAFRSHEARRGAPVDTPDAAPRFQQAPGGTSSFSLASDKAPDAPTVRGPVGGAASLHLGGEDHAAAFRLHEAQREACIETPDAAPRFQQAPGGTSSLNLASDGAPGAAPATRGPVGGKATIILGSDGQQLEQKQEVIDTPDAAPRFPQAPGGTATILLAGGTPDLARGAGSRQAPGGAASIVLGGDYPHDVLAKKQSANAFAAGSNQNCGNVLTERPTTRLHQAPGGASTIILGGNEDAPASVSANAFAAGSNQNCGNVLTERPTTRLHQAPGGASTIILGSSEGGQAQVSSNAFATGNNQNSGNVLTERSTTRLHQAPGGASTLCLGGDYPEGPIAGESRKAVASANRSQQAPGGNATLCLGGDAEKPGSDKAGERPGNENFDASNVAVEQGSDSIKPNSAGGVACAGGAAGNGAGIVLG